jgi:MFS family permease
MTDTSIRSLPNEYWKQWLASAISNLGDGISFVAMPLLALTLTDDERLLSLTVFATFVPWLVLALPVGVAVDRIDRQHLMVIANLVRLAVFVTIGIAAMAERLDIWLLIGLLIVIGACEVLFDSTAQAFLPMLVEPGQLARANGLLFTAEIVAGSLAGLAVGAVLFDASIGLPFTTNALSFAIAAALIIWIRPRRRRGSQAPTSPAQAGLRSGFRWLLAHPLLRTLAAMFAVTNLGLMFGQGVFVKYAVDELGLEGFEFGLLLAITAMGAASGGLIGSRIIGRIGLSTSIVVPYIVFGLAQLVIGVASAVWMVAAAGFLLGAAITIWNVVTVTIRQREIPADRFGRVNAVYRWLGAAASAVGVAAGGFVAYATNVRAPFLVGGAITLLAAGLFARPVLAGLRAESPLTVDG